MAISEIEYYLWRWVADNKLLGPKPDVLEIGEANWYGDVPLARLSGDISKYADPERAEPLLRALQESPNATGRSFDVAKIFYRAFLDYRSIAAIDFGGTPRALKYDLNEPVPMTERFHATVNNGTAEHIFNQYQVFKTIHERTLPGGVMVHVLPFGGWLDHGFYNYNPTFVVDLAAINGYAIKHWIYGELSPLRILALEGLEHVHDLARRGELGRNSLHGLVLQRGPEERPFIGPMQGYYGGTVSAAVREDWKHLR